jgi:hypothetical protein
LDARKLKTLDKENRQLKKLLAEAMVDIVALKDVLRKTENAGGEEGSRDPGDQSAQAAGGEAAGQQ